MHNPAGFLDRVGQFQRQLGERWFLFAMVAATEGFEQVKQSRYLGLIARGWARDEIIEGRDHRGLMGNATLHRLVE